MANPSRAGGVAAKFRKAISAVGIAIAATARDDITGVAFISSGSGAPSAADPNGSLYLRTDGTDGDDSLYMRIAGSWKALQGETA